MGRRPKVVNPPPQNSEMYPGISPADHEEKMIGLAMNLVEQRLRDGTATSQETTFWLRLAAQREQDAINREMMEKQMALMEAKIQSLQASDRMEQLITDAMEAFKRYSGYSDDDDTDY